ncbi:MAG: hypothetical protein ACOC1G_03830 [Phycisphaeraceae bacterium]
MAERETPRPWRLPLEAALAGISGVVTMSVLAGELEPASGVSPVLRGAPAVSIALAVTVVVALAVFALGEAWILQRASRKRRAGLWIAMGGGLVALAASAGMGMIPAVLAAAAVLLIASHQAVGRFVPAVGTVALIVVVGLVWTLANPWMLYVWPVLVAMTHVGICRVVAHSLGAPRPRLSVRGTVLVLGVLSLLALAMVSVHAARMGDVAATAWEAVEPVRNRAWLGPALAGLVMAVGGVAYVVAKGRGEAGGTRGSGGLRTGASPGRRAGSAAGAIQWPGLLLYDAGWLAATTPWVATVPLVLLAVGLAWRWCGPAGGRGS